MTIRVVAKETLLSGKRDEVIEKIFKEMVEKTRVEKGCISYDLHISVDNPDVIAMIECWESMADLDAHMKSEHFQRLIPQGAPYQAAPTSIEVFEQIL